ncbi:hypothetical protein [Micromonospora sp. NBC_01813]|uniref:hypothetical protein n=1 Tax=Micromonospora sp. NBC_01813 TaxID=2975988 RepID=UPI002DDC5799|nr:hypothetical protein [Micromonospora sp. NBC_01813]WSA10485.1 hypothetical protein OG958_06775 [Micromonospora sp. NBC_01813]
MELRSTRDEVVRFTPRHTAHAGQISLIHIASRPGWNCRECGTEWPCETAKVEITSDWSDDRIGMCVYLATLMYEAIDDLLECDAEQLSPPDLYRRFLRWPDHAAETEAMARHSASPGEP